MKKSEIKTLVASAIEPKKLCRVFFKHFDADGIWQDECYEIPFSQITSVTFASRYVDIFSKYV